MKRVCLLGATGSIGDSTLAVLRLNPERYQLFAVTGYQQTAKLLQICQEFQPAFAVVPQSAAKQFRQLLTEAGLKTQVLEGEQGLVSIAEHPEVDILVAAIVGAAGLLPTLAGVKQGKRVLLANKEALVMAGSLFMQAVEQHQATLLPVDSEHNAIFQCLPQHFEQSALANQGVEQLLLTASGGPFRGWKKEQLQQVTPAQAVAHPKWSMGQKISVDSATLMNKGLELIEACWLFDVQPDRVEVVVHPQSIVHSLVRFSDGSVLAQMGNPDMCTPLAHALAWPERITAGVEPLDLVQLGQLSFEAPDLDAFPCLNLARHAFISGGTAPAVLNAANEVAVAAFLTNQLGFNQIPELIDAVLQQQPQQQINELDILLSEDARARELANRLLTTLF